MSVYILAEIRTNVFCSTSTIIPKWQFSLSCFFFACQVGRGSKVIVACGNTHERENARCSNVIFCFRRLSFHPLSPYGCMCESKSITLHLPQRCNTVKTANETTKAPHQHKHPVSVSKGLISRGISTFLMNVFDYDKLLDAVIYSCVLLLLHPHSWLAYLHLR